MGSTSSGISNTILVGNGPCGKLHGGEFSCLDPQSWLLMDEEETMDTNLSHTSLLKPTHIAGGYPQTRMPSPTGKSVRGTREDLSLLHLLSYQHNLEVKVEVQFKK